MSLFYPFLYVSLWVAEVLRSSKSDRAIDNVVSPDQRDAAAGLEKRYA